MSEWSSITFKFDILEPIKAPTEGILSALETAKAILEALLGILKPFFNDLLNPLKALIALLLAAIRALIDQIRSTGFSVLLVHPDFSQPDFAGVINSVSGGYPGFESQVVSKFYDTSDVFRPQYPSGSTVGMLVLYVGADSAGDLIQQLMALISLIKHPIQLALPAPVNLKVNPVRQSGDSISQFKSLFDSDLKQALNLEWQMPQSASGLNSPSFIGQLSSIYNSFRFPNFIIERIGPFPQDTDEKLDTQGIVVYREMNNQTLGKVVNLSTEKYNFPAPISRVPIREQDGTIYRYFPTKISIKFNKKGVASVNGDPGYNRSAFSSSGSLIRGFATGIYKYLDDDPELIPGKTYYYRVRAFFGDPADYLNASISSLEDDATTDEAGNRTNLVVYDSDTPIMRSKPKCTLSKPSQVVKGFVPRIRTSSIGSFNPYIDIYSAVEAALLLNFELPPTYPLEPPDPTIPNPFSPLVGTEEFQLALAEIPPENTSFRNEQRTGWGTLGMVAGQIGFIKQSTTDAKELKNKVTFKATIRRLVNPAVERIWSQPDLEALLAQKWLKVKIPIQRLLDQESKSWTVLGIVNGYSNSTSQKIDSYLSKEDSYVNITDDSAYSGPYPVTAPGTANVEPGVVNVNIENPQPFFGVQERLDLADFLRSALAISNPNSRHLGWYSLTIGDLFPALPPVLFDFEQFILAFLKAVESALKEITDIIQTIIQKIEALIQLLEMLNNLISLLDIQVSVSILAVGATNGSASSLVQELIASEEKPSDNPNGLYSGYVFTFGGPGEGSVAALGALKFILGIK